MAILVAPMYIAEIAPKNLRGLLVTFNQLNIVLGISIAYFSNYFILKNVTTPDMNWRWMLGVGSIPAALYFLLLFIVPSSPRWLISKGRDEEGKKVLKKVNGEDQVESIYNEIKASISKKDRKEKNSLERSIFKEDENCFNNWIWNGLFSTNNRN